MAVLTIIQPIGSRVLVCPTETESKTSSGFFIPETAIEKPQIGKVIAIGVGDES